ncbi:Spermatogenesis- and oogenesis-specific basic helix-loop-helix-containing protein 2 [Thelohanellus kitauei]|uniref:Spermatogenesis-and oogenesis-specific basic helix-loop-helix-containing protein 2 n=1 Tax=Thelohanellus kitauei TaxID=669202 RepID=A0A0C2JK04_THEKT|nr:Spermatogenesis- and oogenesis-specific basic helix-loop-helix-containing protein 2 [Thelohanellus kitauei]
MHYSYNFEQVSNSMMNNLISKASTSLIGNIRHNSKEKHRRERIKNSCIIMRQMLPQDIQQSVKLDMASVLELIVQYLSYIQRSIPHYIITAINESFTATLVQIRQEQNRMHPSQYVLHQMNSAFSSSNQQNICIEQQDNNQMIPKPMHMYNTVHYTPITNSNDQSNENDNYQNVSAVGTNQN